MCSGSPDFVPLEEQVQVLRQQLEHAQKLTSLGELVSTTTHEFNNVLMTIINYAKLGLRCQDKATRDKSLEKILAASQKAARITNTILGVARNRSDAFEPTDLGTLVDDALVLLEREMNKYRIVVERQLEKVPPAPLNANQIQQVLLNLLINARQAMPRGGRIFIKVEHDPADDTVVLFVRDTGEGIPPDKLRRIFDPFFTTKLGPDDTGRGGTGLGLSACRNIVEAHQGRIRVQSTVGKGTAFTIKLPVTRSSAPAANPAVGDVSPAASDQESALGTP
ncbi:MAG: sensor histidine kinase [Planctomycetes bacterium]|nr:sensor histidine kinase [Planctomycetota bacterium]